jgi:hypothetical protein
MTCTLCRHDNAIHTIVFETGRPVFTQVVELTSTTQTSETDYQDVLSHTYSICHRCYTARWRTLAFVFVPLILVYAATLLFVDPHRIDAAVGLILLAAPLIILLVVAPILKSRSTWQKLKRLALQQRGGPPFEAFKWKVDQSDWGPTP